MKLINFNVEDEQKDFLDTLGNYSYWIRDAIELKRGRGEQSLVELRHDFLKKAGELDKIEQEINTLENKLLEHKDELKLGEIKAIEERQILKKKEDKEFIEKYKYLAEYSELSEIKDLDITTLSPILDKLIAGGHRIGLAQLRRWIVTPKEPTPDLKEEDNGGLEIIEEQENFA